MKVEDAEQVSSGGIIIPSTAVAEKPTLGTVIATCDDYYLDDQPMTSLYKEGEMIVFGRYTGVAVTIDRDKYIVLAEKDVLGWVVEIDEDGNQLRQVDRDRMPKIRTEGRK